MVTFVALIVVATAFFADQATAQISGGYATYSNSAGGVCSGSGPSLPAVSMNAAQFANGAACGQCVQITGTGNGAGDTPVSSAPYLATINNVCPQCNYGDIDLQGTGNGKYGIQWSFVACPGSGRKLIEGPFQGDSTVYTVGQYKTKTLEEANEPSVEVSEEHTADTMPEAEDKSEDIANDNIEFNNIAAGPTPTEASDKQEAPAPAPVQSPVADSVATTPESEAVEVASADSAEAEQSGRAQKVSRRLMALN